MEFDPSVKAFENFLKTRGYSESYTKNLCYYVQQLIKFGFNPDSRDYINQIDTVNKFIDSKVSKKIVIYPAVEGFKTYLRFLKIPNDKINDLRVVPKKVKNPRRSNTLTKEEIDKLLTTEDQTIKMIIKLFFYGPLKKYQILKIRAEDIDFDKGEISVEDNREKVKKFISGKLKQDLKDYIISKNIKKGPIFLELSPYVTWYRINKLGRQILKKPISPTTMTYSKINILRNKLLPDEILTTLTGRSRNSLSKYPSLPEKIQKKLFEKYSD